MQNNWGNKTQNEILKMLKEGWDSINLDIEGALQIAKEAEKLSRKLNYEEGIALSIILLARYYGFYGKYDKALKLANEGNDRAFQLGSLEAQIKASYVLGYLYTNLGSLQSALNYYLRGLSLIKENNEEIDPGFLNNIAVVYYDFGDYEEALEFLEEGLKIAKETGHDIQSLILSNMAEIYLLKKDIEKALEYNNKALENFQNNISDEGDLAQCYNIFGLLYKELKQWDKSLDNFHIALNIYEKNKLIYSESEVLLEIGKLYLAQNKKEKAIEFLDSARKKAKKIKALGILKNIYRILSETYEKDGNYKEAFKYLKAYNELNEKFKTKELNDKLTQHLTEFKVEKAQKDAEIQRLKNDELKRKNEEAALKAKILEESYEDIKIIGEIGQKITSTLDNKKVLNTVYKNIQKLMDADIFGICLYAHEKERVEFKILMEQGQKQPLYSVMINNEKSFAAKCIREKKEICINNVDVDINDPLRFAGSMPFQAQSLIYYPLIMEDKVVGAMTVQSYRINAYSDRSIGMIKALASYIAIALNNSQKSEELKAKTNALEIISKTDALTGIYNRRYIMGKIEEEAVRYERTKRAFSIVILDVDYFKSINDIYGHDCGDYVLVKLTKILKNLIRKQDVLARWGGEEFLMLLPETEEGGAVTLCERIREKVENTTFTYKKNKIKLTVTFGIAEYNEDLGIDATINNADKSLYKGKNSGRNCVVC